MSDFFMNTKDVWIETKEFGDWRIKDSEKKLQNGNKALLTIKHQMIIH